MLASRHQLSDQQIFFEVGNPSIQSITLSSMCIPLPDKRTMAFIHLDGEKPMPVLLAPGQATRFWMDCDALERNTIRAGIGRHAKFRVMARDALGNKYVSDALSIKPSA